MKTTLRAFGVILIIFGLILLLQGIGLLPGNFMNGKILSAVYGGVALAVGVVWVVSANRGIGL